MNTEIDQSGKVEQTHRNTILAYSNGKSYAIKISAKNKRKLQEYYRQIGEPRSYVIQVFCFLTFLLIKRDIKKINQMTIDIEYFGKDKIISQILKEICQREKCSFPTLIFHNIGKKSKAHKKAIEIYQKKLQADKTISFEEIHKVIFGKTKRRPALKYRR